MVTISALIVCRNDEEFFKKSFGLVEPYIQEAVLVDMSDEPIKFEHPKLKKIKYQYSEPLNMGEARTLGLRQATQDWIWQIDADEWYPKESCEAIVRACEALGEAISFRVPYHNLSWRYGFKQANFNHLPDRLYRRDVIQEYKGILPNDMTYIKPEFIKFPKKSKGEIGILEYDNWEDQSFINPVQPVIQAPFYHLARTRGYNFEYNKWFRYNKFSHLDWSDEEISNYTKINNWVSGLYDIEPVNCPFEYRIENPKVSVIIPNYNYAQFVGKAIESAQNQTVKPYEIIVVDDFSTDNSIQEIIKYDVKLVRQDHNSQAAGARNAGAVRATGDYLIFLDADDELDPVFIEETLKEMKGDIQVVCTDIQFIGRSNYIHRYEEEFSKETLKQAQNVPSACALIDRRIFEQVGGFNQDWYEDYSFWLRVANAGFNFKHIDKPLFRYRKHGPSRIDKLDEKQAFGFEQLRKYGKI